MTTRLLGLEFADLDADAAAAWVASRPAEVAFGYVVTPNADHLVRLARNPALGAMYRGALVRLLDSRVVARLARLAGLRAPPVAPGSDLTALLLTRHLRAGEQITLVGMTEPTVQRLVARLGLAMPAHHNPPMGFAADPVAFAAAVAFVVAHPARFIFLAVGSPQQERLAVAVAATGQGRGTALCIGASLAFLAGTERRAPRWVQHAGLEWLFRLVRDPRRLARRYLLDSPAVLALLLRERRTRG